MIRRSSCALKFATRLKRDKLETVFDEYTRYLNEIINLLWDNRNKLKKAKFCNQKILDSVPSWISARLKSRAGKRALEIIRSQTCNSKKKDFKPVFKGNSIDLDSLFCELQESENSFDKWLHLQSLGNKIIVDVPIKLHKHFLKFKDWSLSKSVQLRRVGKKFYADFIFEKDDQRCKTDGEILGIDLGINKLLSCSNSQVLGTNLKILIRKLYQRKHGSRNWKQTINEIRNYVGFSVNQIDLSAVSVVVLEDLAGLSNKRNGRNNKTTRKLLSFWMRTLAELRIQLRCQLDCIKVEKIDPKYTSQECPKCHHTDRRNRHGENFQCVKCGFIGDADRDVAALNIRDRYRQSRVACA